MNALAANDIEVPRSDRAERRRRLAGPDLEFRSLLLPQGIARLTGPAAGAGLGRLPSRTVPAR
jgi:hypothetical protein